jgi:hypothetical protein
MASASIMNSTEDWVYVAIDGDDIGRHLEKLIASGREAAVRSFSRAVGTRLQALVDLAERRGGRVVFCAGDSLLACVSRATAEVVCQTAVSRSREIVFSGGIGPGMAEAMLALRLAMAQGRRRYVTWESLVR